MFRPVVAIIRFYYSTHLRLFYTIRVAACLMRRSQHQNPCWSTVPLYWVCVGEPRCQTLEQPRRFSNGRL